jgi:hypothetical protein
MMNKKYFFLYCCILFIIIIFNFLTCKKSNFLWLNSNNESFNIDFLDKDSSSNLSKCYYEYLRHILYFPNINPFYYKGRKWKYYGFNPTL